MKRLCIIILIIGQALALTAWASAPMINEQGTDGVHMHIDKHHNCINPQLHAHDEHEHSESCHLHLTVQLNNTAILTVYTDSSKSIQNAHVAKFIGRILTGPPTPPPTA